TRHLGPGTYQWTTPTGHTYRRESDGTITPLTTDGTTKPPPALASSYAPWTIDPHALDEDPPPF
ncbi:hypothetical protein V2J56_12805, partial [Georgenia sp. MJ206]|uniref:hypothetical protein n=1 Tax=Georgenia wangjunii TaxID=3117730 RepID=UPI002F266EB3